MPKKKIKSIDLDINGLFETPDQRKLGIAAFVGFRRSMGWQLIEKALNNTIEDLTDQILSGENGGEKTAEAKLYFRDRIITERKVLQGLIDLPDALINNLKDDTKSTFEYETLDPYEDVDKDE